MSRKESVGPLSAVRARTVSVRWWEEDVGPAARCRLVYGGVTLLSEARNVVVVVVAAVAGLRVVSICAVSIDAHNDSWAIICGESVTLLIPRGYLS